MIFKKLISAAVCAAMLSGCMMGPNYKRPELDLPVQPQEGEDYSVFENYQWWEMFGDEQLNKLETEALLYNRDLRQAVARVDQARASVGSAVADQLPTIGIQGGSGRAGNDYGSGQTLSTGTVVASVCVFYAVGAGQPAANGQTDFANAQRKRAHLHQPLSCRLCNGSGLAPY